MKNIIIATYDERVINLFVRKVVSNGQNLFMEDFIFNRNYVFPFTFIFLHKYIVGSAVNFILFLGIRGSTSPLYYLVVVIVECFLLINCVFSKKKKIQPSKLIKINFKKLRTQIDYRYIFTLLTHLYSHCLHYPLSFQNAYEKKGLVKVKLKNDIYYS